MMGVLYPYFTVKMFPTIFLTIDCLSSIRPFVSHFSDILIRIQHFFINEIVFVNAVCKMAVFCFGLYMLKTIDLILPENTLPQG